MMMNHVVMADHQKKLGEDRFLPGQRQEQRQKNEVDEVS